MSENQKRLHVQHYYSTNKNSVPEVKVEGVENENALIDGEIAINHADEKLFIKKNGATVSNDVVTFSSDEKLDEKYAPKKDYVVNGENEHVHVSIERGEDSFENINIKMGEFDYNLNGSADSANGIGILVENNIDSSGLIVENGYVKLTGESESGSSSTNGGSVKLFGETVCLNAWNNSDEGEENFDNTLTLNKDGLNVKIDNLEGDFKNFSVNKDGLTFDNSRVVTEQILGEHDELVKVDENGIANKSEITIGSFEIKTDKPYNYTLEGHYEPWDWGRYTDEYATDCTFVAEYNHEGAKLYSDGFEEDYWAYEFVVTEAKIYVSYENEGVEDFKWISFNELVGNVLPIPVNLLDKLVFTDGVADVEEYIHIRVDAENDNIYDAKIIETAPFLLKSTSKALLNGSPVITAETLAKSDIVSNLNKKINEEANRAKDVENDIMRDYVKSDNLGSPVTIQGSEMSIIGETLNIGVSTTDYEKHLYINGDGLVYGEYDENRVEINSEGVKIKVKDIIDSTIDEYEYHEAVLSNKGVLTLDGNKVASEKFVKEITSGGIKFRGIYTELPWDDTLSMTMGVVEDFEAWKEENLQGFSVGDLIIVAPKHEEEYNEQYGGNPSADPSKEYILTVYETDDAYHYHWELLGETTVVDKRITDEINRAKGEEIKLNTAINGEISRAVAKENELLGKINANTTAISNKADKSEIPSLEAYAKTVDLNKETERAIAKESELENKIDNFANVKQVTHAELYDLFKTSKLVPNASYLITDYVTETVQENTVSAHHQFDILVTAISENELREDVRVLPHEGDTYFANSNLSAWEVKYTIANDSRFAWSDPNGKGVIYYMKDEYNNEAPYDFKNICFTNHNEPYYIGSKRNAPSTLSVGNVFTFTYLSYLGANAKDGTMSGLFTNNKIDTYYKNGIMTLGNNISISYEYSSGKKHVISNNILHKGCYNNTIVNTNDIVLNISCHDNYVLAYSSSITSGVIFDPQCGNNIICGGGYDIKFGGSCAYNIIAPVCGNILFHNDVVGNIIGATDTYYNGKTFANSSFYNSEWFGEEEDLKNKTIFDIINEKGINLNYGTSVKYLTFHHNARFNIVGNGAQLITIDDRSHHNVIGEYVTRVNMGKVCYKNIVYNIGYSVDGIAPKTYPSDIIFDNKTMCCTIGDNITSAGTFNIHINQNCYSVKIPAGSENITIGNNVWCIESTNVLKNVNVKDDNANIVLKSDSAENVILNYTIETGTKTNNYSTSDEKTEIFIKSPNSSIASTIFNDGSNINEKLITNSGESLFIKKNDNSITVNPDLYPTPGKSGAAPSVGKNNGCLAIGGYADYNGGVCNANGSFAGGASSIANAICSIAYGVGVKTEKAANKYGEVAFGMYNKPSNSTLLTIGNGSGESDEKRSNAFEVNKNGSAIFSGSVTAYAFYEKSDERLKVFKSDIDVDLDKLAELRKSYFTFVEDPGTNHLGVSAQEIKELYPEIVTEGSDGFLKVDYAKLSVVALKAVDILNAKNKELEERLSKIEKALNLQ